MKYVYWWHILPESQSNFQFFQLVYLTSSHKSWQPSFVVSRDSHALQLYHQLNILLNISYIYIFIFISTWIMVDLRRFLTHFMTFCLVDIIPWMVRSKSGKLTSWGNGRLSHPRRCAGFLSIIFWINVWYIFTYEFTGWNSGIRHVGFNKPKNLGKNHPSSSIKNGILKMIFLFPRWDMLMIWRVSIFAAPQNMAVSGLGKDHLRSHLDWGKWEFVGILLPHQLPGHPASRKKAGLRANEAHHCPLIINI